jgi:hypothetical protein
MDLQSAADSFNDALQFVSGQSTRLAGELHFNWSEQQRQAVLALRFHRAVSADPRRPLFAALIGGASSGKSTVFNNLLDGHRVSQVTMKGHTTRGPILAAHENLRDQLETWAGEDRSVFASLDVITSGMDENLEGKPESLAVVYHGQTSLANVLLLDTPDFTSEMASQEGDVALSLLPWFDLLIVVIDHERWFDRQILMNLKPDSQRFGQERVAIFNRTAEGPLSDADRRTLEKQSERFGARAYKILDFHRGRGLRRFLPDTVADLSKLLDRSPIDRVAALARETADSVNQALNDNEERQARLDTLRESLDAEAVRYTPSLDVCLQSLMTSRERRQLEFVSRVLRLDNAAAALKRQTSRWRSRLARIPILGGIVGRPAPELPPTTDASDLHQRLEAGCQHYSESAKKIRNRLFQLAVGSPFWGYIRKSTSQRPADHRQLENKDPGLLDDAIRAVDEAMDSWNRKVETECKRFSLPVTSAVGISVAGISAVALLALIPGPMSALTWPIAISALKAATANLAAVGLAPLAAGKPTLRALGLVSDHLLPSQERKGVLDAVAEYRSLIERDSRMVSEALLANARSLVLSPGDPLLDAMETLRDMEAETS